MRYVIVTGGVVSGLGKGIACSSIGILLQAAELNVTAIKIDPYLNIDAGTISPYEHGEVFVLQDGGEADLDLGNYERLLGIRLSKEHNITTGKVYDRVIRRERQGGYLGKTVQIVPHLTDAVQDWIEKAALIPVGNEDKNDICLIELGGTVGDIESQVFLESLRQLKQRLGRKVCHLHVSLAPTVNGEVKSKPTQHGVKELRSAGLTPDIILCRSEKRLKRELISKIASFCMVPPENVISGYNVSSIYMIPQLFHNQGMEQLILRHFGLDRSVDLDNVETLNKMGVHLSAHPSVARGVKIGIVGKYTSGGDSYLSIAKSLEHASYALNINLVLIWIDSETVADPDLKGLSGILIPGGFGGRGFEGMLRAIRYARVNRIPLLGICLGLQAAVVEFARNVLGLSANSTEFDPDCKEPVIMHMSHLKAELGGTMRLGDQITRIERGTLAHELYRAEKITERHRHRYEVNVDYLERLQGGGLIVSGFGDSEDRRVEVVEISGHPFFLCVQYHPEFRSTPMRPNECFLGFVGACGR